MKKTLFAGLCLILCAGCGSGAPEITPSAAPTVEVETVIVVWTSEACEETALKAADAFRNESRLVKVRTEKDETFADTVILSAHNAADVFLYPEGIDEELKAANAVEKEKDFGTQGYLAGISPFTKQLEEAEEYVSLLNP